MKIYDYLVVGSGASGAMAAQTLVEAGKDTVMVDVGERDTELHKLIPDQDFISLRTNDVAQHKYFIGENAEGIDWTDVGKGAQITPPRMHMLARTKTYLPISSDTFSPVESLGYGGLGIGWGLQCWEYSADDLKAAGLEEKPMREAYNIVAQRIGVSGKKDTAAKYTLGKLTSYQPSPKMDRNHEFIYKKYKKHESSFNRKGIFIGRTPLALITKDTDKRKGYAYKDMDFYSDRDQSAWRPWITVNKLLTKKNFTYIGGLLVVRFNEKKDHVEIECLEVNNKNKSVTLRCRKLILATSALGSARIALRSIGKAGQTLPILCNQYTYIPCLQPAMIGKEVESKKLGFAQLSVFLDKKHDNSEVSVASLYSYQSLMMFRTIRQLPLDFSDGREILRHLVTGIVIMGVHHPDRAAATKKLSLIKDKKSPTGDVLSVEHILSDDDKRVFQNREKRLMKTMRQLGTFPLKRIDPGMGASIHYAGTLPYSDEEKELTLTKSGKLRGTNNVYVADSSGFTFLPAPGLTFSLMANAYLVTKGLLKDEQ